MLAHQCHDQMGRTNPRWVAYMSDESGRFEIYIDSFPEPRKKIRISIDGGRFPQWRGDGRELFFLSADYKLMAVDVIAGPVLKLGEPHKLFSAPIFGGGTANEVHRWDVAADGQKFLITTVSAQSISAPFTVVLNWQAGLRK